MGAAYLPERFQSKKDALCQLLPKLWQCLYRLPSFNTDPVITFGIVMLFFYLIIGALSQMNVSRSALEEAGILPNIVEAGRMPEQLAEVEVTFGGNIVTPGEKVPASLVTECPTVHVKTSLQQNLNIFAFMTDPDAPSRANPVAAEWAHWAAESTSTTVGSASRTLLSYAPPTPPQGTGPHRYVTLVYTGKTDNLHHIPSSHHRRKWGGKGHVENIAKENHLTLIGIHWFLVEE